jgi:hypothetical protein
MARKWGQGFEMDRKGELQEATGKCEGKLSKLTSKNTL